MQKQPQDKLQQLRAENGAQTRFKRALFGYDRAAVDSLYAEYDAICDKNNQKLQELSQREHTLQTENETMAKQLEQWESTVKQQYETLDEVTVLPLQARMELLQNQVQELCTRCGELTSELVACKEKLRHTESMNCILKDKLLQTNAALSCRSTAIHETHSELSLQLAQVKSISQNLAEEVQVVTKLLLEKVELQTRQLKSCEASGTQSLQTLYRQLYPQPAAQPDVLSVGSLKIQAK